MPAHCHHTELSQGLVEALRVQLGARPAEDRLLAAAGRLHVGKASGERVSRLLDEPVDWDRFVAKAEWHRIAPLVHITLSQPAFATHVPEAGAQRLRARYLANGVSNLVRQRELRRVVAVLNGTGIVPVLLKGAALIHTVYPNPALRQMSDLDLLVRRDDLAAAELSLLALGYEPAEKEWSLGQFPPNWYEKKYRPRDRKGVGTMVELHWGLVRPGAPFRVDVGELLRASEPVSVDGVDALVLSPIHQLLHLCTHLAFNDGFGVGISRLVDLHEAVERFRDRLDWEELAADARRFRASLCLRYSLAVASTLFGTDLPTGILEDQRDPPLRPSLAAASLERVLANDEDQAPLPSTLARLVTTDRADLRALLHILLARPRHLRHSYRLLHPARLLRLLRYARLVRRGNG